MHRGRPNDRKDRGFFADSAQDFERGAAGPCRRGHPGGLSVPRRRMAGRAGRPLGRRRPFPMDFPGDAVGGLRGRAPCRCALPRSSENPMARSFSPFAVIGIEVSLIASIMLTGDANPTLARDTMLAVLMIVLNGLIGGALLIGGLVHRGAGLQSARRQGLHRRPGAAGSLRADPAGFHGLDDGPDLYAGSGVLFRAADGAALRRLSRHPDRTP